MNTRNTLNDSVIDINYSMKFILGLEYVLDKVHPSHNVTFSFSWNVISYADVTSHS